MNPPRPLLLLTALVAFVTGCSRDGESQLVPFSGSITLTYWPAPNPQEIQLADTLVRLWNRLHPSVQVRMQPIPVSQSTEEVLLAAIAAGTTPDVCSNIWPGALRDYTAAGGLMALDQFSDFDSVVTTRVPPEVMKFFRSGQGRVYQIPWKTNPVMMFCNVGLFREAGVPSLPRTYAEYLEAGKKIVRDRNGDGQTDVWLGERDIRPIWWQRLFDFYPFYIAASGGKTFFDRQQERIDRKTAGEVFAFFQTCYQKNYFPRTFFQGGDPFLLGVKATHFSGPWQVAAIERFAPSMEYEVIPLPVPERSEQPVYTYGDFKNISVFSRTNHPKEAWEFVKFLITPEHDLLLLKIANQIPVRGDLLRNELYKEYFFMNPQMTRFAGQALYTRSIDEVPDLKEIFDGLSQEYEACAVYGKKAPATAVEDAARRIRSIMEWNQ